MSHPDVKSRVDLRLHRMLVARATGLRRYLSEHIPKNFSRVVVIDDLVQDIWIAAFRGFAGFEDTGERSFDRWLQTIANNKLSDALRTVKRTRRGSGKLPLAPRPPDDGQSGFNILEHLAGMRHRTPSREVSAMENSSAIQDALSELQEDWRTALVMRYVEGASIEQIARRMDRSPVAVNGLLFRGLRALKRRMGRAGQYFSDSASVEKTIEHTSG